MTKSSTNNHLIPWPCLISDDDPPSIPNPNPKPNPSSLPVPKTQQKTFAQALSNVCDVPLSQLPQPCMKGDRVSIEIPEDEFIAGVEECKYALHGRVILPKGSTPLAVDSLRTKLQILWKSIGKWGITSIGKGFYEFTFSSIEDQRRVRSVGSWTLNTGFLKLFVWSHDFSPSMQQQTTAQVWIRIYGLAQEYWRKRILFAIARGVGSPICTDTITSKPRMERTFGHYARVLVDMDLNNELVHRILVERKGFAFFVDIDYETIPDFCTNCQITGHHIGVCKKLRALDVNQGPHKMQGKAKDRKEWVPKPPEVLNVDNTPGKSPERNKEDVDLEKEINEAIEAHNSAFSKNTPEVTPKVSEAQEVSSERSEFVENTKTLDGQEVDNHSEGSVATKQDLAQRDVDFLKASWVNMAELDRNIDFQDDHSELQVINPVLENVSHQVSSPKNMQLLINTEVDDDGFQQVISKGTKKAQKAATLKSSYTTRSKVGTSKPSQ